MRARLAHLPFALLPFVLLPFVLVPFVGGCSREEATQAAADVSDVSDVSDANDDVAVDAPSPFKRGPYGTTPRSVAGPFVAPTTAGDWSFEEKFDGEDHYVFVAYQSTNAYSKSLFKPLSLQKLLAQSPKNMHWFFLYRDDRATFDAFVAAAAPILDEHWAARVHFVTTRADELEGWLGDVFRERTKAKLPYERYDRIHFGVDRTQHVREVGMLGRLGGSAGITPDLSFAAQEPLYWEFERAREAKLASVKATIVPMMRDEVVVEDVYKEVELPDEATMATFDTLEVDLTMNCVNHRDGECGAWDYISDLRLCGDAPSDGGKPACDVELARWITTYWREGRWVTDISGMLAFLKGGGRKTLRWYASKQWDPRPANYVASLSLRLSNTGKGMRPVSAVRLFEGGALNDKYGAAHPPVKVDVPTGTKKAELYALITGHGSETDQCAEFCNHTHHFTLNGGTRRSLEFPMAKSNDGCRKRVEEGVVPNQHGTWYFGRGGWCPGLDVRPFLADVTKDAVLGGDNTFSYEALIGTSAPAAGSAYGNVHMNAYLVLWR
ncbi:MAG: hypothetical protein HYV09_38760 [Deltaproteobacteria bacterium]|nr:hypothetical protein [Deltaproteobacteria bacterium]